jgi:hypothetical protein
MRRPFLSKKQILKILLVYSALTPTYAAPSTDMKHDGFKRIVSRDSVSFLFHWIDMKFAVRPDLVIFYFNGVFTF